MGLLDETLLLHSVERFRHAIGRAIAYNDDFVSPSALFVERLNASSNGTRLVVARNQPTTRPILVWRRSVRAVRTLMATTERKLRV